MGMNYRFWFFCSSLVLDALDDGTNYNGAASKVSDQVVSTYIYHSLPGFFDFTVVTTL